MLHSVADQTALDALAVERGLLVKNVHQLCSITMGPAGKPLDSVDPGWMLLQKIKWIKKDGDDEYIPVVQAALDNFMEAVAGTRDDMPFSKRSFSTSY